MPDHPSNDPNITILQLKGLNERKQFAQDDLGEFDWVKGFLPINQNTLTRAEGCKLYLKLAEAVYGICQTHDSRKNIIIQGQDNVWVISEDELFDTVYVPSLTIQPITGGASEEMSYARIVHRETVNTDGGAIGTLWAQRPLTHIVSHINPDGSAAAFVTLVANQFTLVAGVYRINGGFTVCSSAVDGGIEKQVRVRLFNVTTGLPAWDGLSNEESDSMFIRDAKLNVQANIGGHLNLAGSTLLEIQDIRTALGANVIRGNASNAGSFEIYGWIDIWKSA